MGLREEITVGSFSVDEGALAAAEFEALPGDSLRASDAGNGWVNRVLELEPLTGLLNPQLVFGCTALSCIP